MIQQVKQNYLFIVTKLLLLITSKLVDPDSRQRNSLQQNSFSICREDRFEAVQLSVPFMIDLPRQNHVELIDVHSSPPNYAREGQLFEVYGQSRFVVSG